MPISDDFWLPENKQDDPDEAEETFSFSDLPIYSNLEETDRISSSSYDHDQEVFEFEFDLSGLKDEPESIIFCGKLIPNREASLENKTNPQHNFNKREIFGRKSSSSSCSKSRSSSMLAKSKWYQYMFGLGRFPVEMDLRDMKNRQSRRSQTRMLRSRGDKNKGRGLWGLMHNANTMVKSLTCIKF